jgi:hypothetical protein
MNLGPSIHKKEKIASKFQPSLSIENLSNRNLKWRSSSIEAIFFLENSKTALQVTSGKQVISLGW